MATARGTRRVGEWMRGWTRRRRGPGRACARRARATVAPADARRAAELRSAQCAVRGAQQRVVDDAIATYAVQTALPEDLPQRTHFFWTSGALFRDALARWPEIADRWHASGPGRTSRVIRDALGSEQRNSASGSTTTNG